MIIPHTQLSADALQGIIEEFVLRDNNLDLSLEEKSGRVLKMLKKGELEVVYDAESETCSILSKSEARAVCEAL